jgi:hypothetical protein
MEVKLSATKKSGNAGDFSILKGINGAAFQNGNTKTQNGSHKLWLNDQGTPKL